MINFKISKATSINREEQNNRNCKLKISQLVPCIAFEHIKGKCNVQATPSSQGHKDGPNIS